MIDYTVDSIGMINLPSLSLPTKDEIKARFSFWNTLTRVQRISLVSLLASLLVIPLAIFVSTKSVYNPSRAALPSTPPITPPNLQSPVNWVTDRVSLQADDFFLIADNVTYTAKDANVSVHSDPVDYRTTLELIWSENQKEMRLFMYFDKNNSNWWSGEIRTYNNQQPGDWIYYTGHFFESPLGSTYNNQTLDLYSDPNNQLGGWIHFSNLRLKAFLELSPTPTPTVQPVTPTPTSSVVTCTTPWNFRGYVFQDGTNTKVNYTTLDLYGSFNQYQLGTLLVETQSYTHPTYGAGYYKLDTNFYYPYYFLVMQTPAFGYQASRVSCGIGGSTCLNTQPDKMRHSFSSQCVGGGFYNNNNFYLSLGTGPTPTPVPTGTGTQVITINARGFRSNTVRQQPKINLYLNGQNSAPVAIFTTTSTNQNFTYTSNNPVNRIDVVFPNQDYVSTGNTTYLIVNSVSKGVSQLYDGNATCIYDRGTIGSTTNNPFDGKSTISCQHQMFWNGSLKLTNF